MSTTLANIQLGYSAIIDKYTDADISSKMMEMGCIPGERVTVSSIAPMGDPIAINIAGYLLSLRKNEASQIIVTQVD